jgi:hypothetical protein
LVTWIIRQKAPAMSGVARTALSVAVMPFAWWAVVRGASLKRASGTQGALLNNNVTGSCCLLIEDPKRAPTLAWFMVMTAIS